MSTLSNFSTTFDPASSVSIFGTFNPQAGMYPNDSIMLDVYNYTNDYLETVPRLLRSYSRRDLNISINVEDVLYGLGYYSGKYNVTARFLRNYLGSIDGDKLVIQEISTDRLEVRVRPVEVIDSTNTNSNFIEYFEAGFFLNEKKKVLPNLYLFVDGFTYYKVFDYVQDPFTFQDEPFSIIFKLAAPLPNDIRIDDLVWIAQEASAPIRDSVTVVPRAPRQNITTIAGPNFDIVSQNSTNYVTDYRNWNDILSTNTDTSLSIVNKLFSGSLIEGVELNVDFRKFENFVHFGSAEERLRNFQYKMELLEYYDSRIYALSQSYIDNSFPTAVTTTPEFTANILDAKTKRANLLGGFDTYEKYLYYQSSSYESSSYGEFYPTTWPKQNSTKPYINYSVTSSQAIEWFEGIVASASQYDLNNLSSLRKIIPEHVYVNPSNDQYILFVDMMGHYFDLIYQYVHQLTSVNKRYESLTEGFAKDLVYSIGQSLGLNAENGSALEELWSYFLGTDASGSLLSPTYGISSEDRTKEVWKRIVANLPYLLKTKGTARGIRALINCYGIPSTILRVREYGGPEPTYYSATQEEYDQFYYGLYLSGSTSISIPAATGGGVAVELRFRLHSSSLNQNTTYNVMSGPIAVSINPFLERVTVGGQNISVPLNETDTDWWSVLANHNDKAYVGTNKYGKALIYSSSGNVTVANNAATIPGGATSFRGYINEYRSWAGKIDVDTFENHVLAPTSFQGPADDALVGSTTAYDSLKVRHTFGADGKKFNASVTTSIASSHPNQTSTVGNATLTGFGSDTASYWIPQVETHYLEVVDGGPTRKVGNKIRIETTVVSASNQVQTNSSVLDSLQDLQPVDSPRVTVAFSPTDEVDEDINEQFGGLNLDDFIGDPEDYYRDEYSRLASTRHNYFKKYGKRNNTQGFIRLIQKYDSSLFQLVKQFVPERAVLHTGLVVESHVLHRNKIANKQPSYESLHWSSSIDPEPFTEGNILPLEGAVDRIEDLVGLYSTYEGSGSVPVQAVPLNISNINYTQANPINASLAYTTIGAAIEYNNGQELELADSIQTQDAEGAQYSYFTWFQTGSGDNDWVYAQGVSQDIWNPIQPVVLQNALSDVYVVYQDRFNNRFLTDNLERFVTEGNDTNLLLDAYGMVDDVPNGTLYSVTTFNGEYVLFTSISP